MSGHRKRVKHFHEPGDVHELTFSTYQRRPILMVDECRRELAIAIDRAVASQAFRLVAFVMMPEHVHLLVSPEADAAHVDQLLAATKRPFSFRIKQRLVQHDPVLLDRLTIRERPGKETFRFWQEGAGYDRNLSNETTVLAAIDYIHQNPVRRGLVVQPDDWKWSSARWYRSDGRIVDPDLPTIHGLPSNFFVVE